MCILTAKMGKASGLLEKAKGIKGDRHRVLTGSDSWHSTAVVSKMTKCQGELMQLLMSGSS